MKNLILVSHFQSWLSLFPVLAHRHPHLLRHRARVAVDAVLPELQHAPPLRPEPRGHAPPPLLVVGYLVAPEPRVGAGLPVAPAAAVPEAAVYEDRHAPGLVGDVGRAEDRPVVDPVPHPHRPDNAPDRQLRARVLRAYRRHDPAALLRG